MAFDRRKKQISAAVAVTVIGLTGYKIFSASAEETDDAYIVSHVATLSSKVTGLVSEVLVEENYKVKKDQILIRIDQRDYQNALANLKAELGQVEANLVFAEKDFKRSARLYVQQAVAEQDRDIHSAKFQELQKKREALESLVQQAELNLAFTEIRAPADGTIGKKLVEPGMVVGPGQPLLSFVDAVAPWVVANFKETQLKKMKIGQKAEVEIDSIGGKVFEGTLESFAPGTGATFALIPPENATGNFTKIVQRVPVRIKFAPESIKGFEDRIIPGLSVEAKVYLGQEASHVAAAPPKLAEH